MYKASPPESRWESEDCAERGRELRTGGRFCTVSGTLREQHSEVGGRGEVEGGEGGGGVSRGRRKKCTAY